MLSASTTEVRTGHEVRGARLRRAPRRCPRRRLRRNHALGRDQPDLARAPSPCSGSQKPIIGKPLTVLVAPDAIGGAAALPRTPGALRRNRAPTPRHAGRQARHRGHDLRAGSGRHRLRLLRARASEAGARRRAPATRVRDRGRALAARPRQPRPPPAAQHHHRLLPTSSARAPSARSTTRAISNTRATSNPPAWRSPPSSTSSTISSGSRTAATSRASPTSISSSLLNASVVRVRGQAGACARPPPQRDLRAPAARPHRSRRAGAGGAQPPRQRHRPDARRRLGDPLGPAQRRRQHRHPRPRLRPDQRRSRRALRRLPRRRRSRRHGPRPVRSTVGLALTRSLLAVNQCALSIDPAGGTGTLFSLVIPASLVSGERKQLSLAAWRRSNLVSLDRWPGSLFRSRLERFQPSKLLRHQHFLTPVIRFSRKPAPTTGTLIPFAMERLMTIRIAAALFARLSHSCVARRLRPVE